MKSTLTIESFEGVDPFANQTSRPRWTRFAEFITALKSIIGAGLTTRSVQHPFAIAGTASATGTVICLGAQAADTVTLNGQVITAVAGAAAADQFTVDGDDVADASSLVAAINASAQTLISGVLRATNFAATITLASVAAGEWVELMGIRLTAVAGAADLSSFTIAGTDTQDAASLVTVINAHPTLRERFFASNASGVVTVRRLPPAGTSTPSLAKSGAGITLSGAALAATSTVFITSNVKGRQANANTLASSNGTRLAVSGARLTGGAQETFTF